MSDAIRSQIGLRFQINSDDQWELIVLEQASGVQILRAAIPLEKAARLIAGQYVSEIQADLPTLAGYERVGRTHEVRRFFAHFESAVSPDDLHKHVASAARQHEAAGWKLALFDPIVEGPQPRPAVVGVLLILERWVERSASMEPESVPSLGPRPEPKPRPKRSKK